MTEYLLNIRYNLVNSVDSIFGLWLEISVWILIILFFAVILLIILWFVSKKLSKIILSKKQKLIYEYDNIFYLLARVQYQKEIDKKSIGWDPCIAAIKPILNLKEPTYIANKILIKENIKKVEVLLWEQVISDGVWKKISIFDRKIRSLSLWAKIVKIFLILIVLSLLAVFIYIFAN